jgi:hypothetical protein
LRSHHLVDGAWAETFVDVLFKPAKILRLRKIYNGLIVRFPTEAEARQIEREVGGVDQRYGYRPVVLESEGLIDYVVALACGWTEWRGSNTDPSPYAGLVEPDEPAWMRRTLFGVDGGFGAGATVPQLADALASPEGGPRPRAGYGHVWVLLYQITEARDAGVKPIPVGVFLTRDEAEQEIERRRRTPRSFEDDWWIESAPIAI